MGLHTFSDTTLDVARYTYVAKTDNLPDNKTKNV